MKANSTRYYYFLLVLNTVLLLFNLYFNPGSWVIAVNILAIVLSALGIRYRSKGNKILEDARAKLKVERVLNQTGL